MRQFVVAVSAILMVGQMARPEDIVVSSSEQLASALRRLEPGVNVLIEPGEYRGGHYLSGVSGRQGRPVVIAGRDPNNVPVFSGGGQALHLADCSWLTLRNIMVEGFPSNGINIDDGGSFETPAHHITVENVTIVDTGPRGNHDGLKMSGVDEFVVRKCRFAGWGGSGIDMVGCHKGVVEDCVFEGKEGFSQSNAVQLKGGTSEVLVQCCLFRNAGERAINLGGSTGLAYFRPAVGDYEASKITVAGNRFVGGVTPLAWVTADGGYVHHNTIVLPEKWVLRILQETRDERFKRCHDGVFEKNLIVFDSRVSVFVNVGPGTSPESFRFEGNLWYDMGGRRKPELPTAEIGGIYQAKLRMGPENLRMGTVEPVDERLDVGAKKYVRAR